MQAEAINTTRETDEENHTDTQCIHVWPDNGKKCIIHIYNPPSCKLNLEQDLSTHFNTIYTRYFNGHSPLWGYPDHNATGHIIEYMLTASNLILLYDEAATPTLYHRSTGTTSTPDLNLVSADIVNITQYSVQEDIRSDHRPTLIQLTTEQCSLNVHGDGDGTTKRQTGLSSAKYQIKTCKDCSLGNNLTRTTAKSVMASKTLPSNPSRGVTDIRTHHT